MSGKLDLHPHLQRNLAKGTSLINTTKDKRERVSRLLEMHANQRKDRDEFFTGDIAACIGLKYTSTGDTLCAEDNPLLLEKMDFPEPVISMAIEPKSKADREKLSHGSRALFLKKIPPSASSPTKRQARRSSQGWESSTWRSSATGCSASSASRPTSANLKSPTKRRSRSPARPRPSTSSSPAAAVNTPTSASKSNRTKKAKATKSSARSSAASSQKNTSLLVSKGSKKDLATGVLAGYRLVDVKVAIIYGSYHEVDSNEMAFKICGSMAVKEAARKCKPIILEPIMKVVVTTPEQFMGDVIGDINRRRGKILNQDNAKKQSSIVESEVPLSEMFGYSTQLRSMSSGRATYTMEPSHFERVPTKIQEEITKK